MFDASKWPNAKEKWENAGGELQTGWGLPRRLSWTPDRKFKREGESWSELFYQDQTSTVLLREDQINRTGPIYWLIIDRCKYVGWLSSDRSPLAWPFLSTDTHTSSAETQTNRCSRMFPPVNALIMVWPLLQACLIEARLDPSPGFLKFPSRHILKWLLFYGFPTLKRF